MDIDNLKIGIALSGGGIRATVFHLGIFKYLAERGLMSHVASISSVSGASVLTELNLRIKPVEFIPRLSSRKVPVDIFCRMIA